MSEMDRVWIRVKQQAMQLARSSMRCTVDDARTAVLKIFREERACEPATVALEFLSAELLALAREYGGRAHESEEPA